MIKESYYHYYMLLSHQFHMHLILTLSEEQIPSIA